MKKFFVVALVFAVAVALVSAMGCTTTASGPTSAEKTATAVAAVIAAEGTAVAGTAVYQQDFETSVGGFAIDSSVTTAISAASLSTVKSYYGSHSAALTIQMTSTHQASYVDKDLFNSPPTTWVGKTVTMHVWIPAVLLASTYVFEITMQYGAGWATANSWITSGLVADQWNTLTFVIPGTCTSIDDVGFNIQQNGGTDMTTTAVLYIDGISVN